MGSLFKLHRLRFIHNALACASTRSSCHGSHHGLKQGQGIEAFLGPKHDGAKIFPEHGKHQYCRRWRCLCGDGIAGQYGPGRTIDTNQPILVSHAQVRGGDGLMSASNTWLNSNGKTADWNACGDSNYVKNMGYSLEGIVAAFSLWGGPDIDMGWLDGCTGCGGTCNLGGSSVTWTNFALEANKNSPNPKVRAAEGA